MSRESAARLLKDAAPEFLCFTNVPNARLAEDLTLLRLLDEVDKSASIDELRRAVHEETAVSSGIDPAALWELQRDLPYTVNVSAFEFAENGCFDVIFRRGDWEWPLTMPARKRRAKARRGCANDALQRMSDEQFGPRLRAYLQERVPEYMLP